MPLRVGASIPLLYITRAPELHYQFFIESSPLKVQERRRAMMQMNEIRQRFDHVEQTIHQAAQACESSVSLPMDLKSSIQKLEQQSGQAKQAIQQAQDEERVRQVIDELEDLGDQARDACERGKDAVDDNVKSAVMQAHRELSDLKHQLH
jgi:phage regulator Rha-like protein